MRNAITATELNALVTRTFPYANAWILDATYAEITELSLRAATRYAHRQLLRAGVGSWQSYADCDDWAIQTWRSAQLMHAKARYLGRAPETQAAAVGVLLYVPSATGTGHAINVAVMDGQIVGWEPQKQMPRYVTFSDEEKRSFTRFLW